MGQGFWGAFPRRHRLSLLLWKTQWRLSPGGTGYPCRCGARGGLVFFGCLSSLPLAYLSAPYPPNPLPRRGRGRPKLFFARGFAPCIPSIRPPAALVRPAAVENSMAAFPRRHLLDLPRGRGPSQTPPSLATDSSISPGPPSPWLPALFTSAAPQPPRHPWAPLTPAEQATQGESPPLGTTAAGSVSAAGGLMPGCRGRSPRRNKVIISPFPAGEGGRGDRGQKQS